LCAGTGQEQHIADYGDEGKKFVPRGTSRYNFVMTRGLDKPEKIEPDRYRLGEPGRTDLLDFCEAMLGADQSKVIRAAVSAFIRAELDRNEGIRHRYEALKRARTESGSPHVRLIRPEKKC
jgi:hypothetical protein